MPRRAFLAVAPPGDGELPADIERMCADAGWRAVGASGPLRVWTDRKAGFDVHTLPGGQGLVIGDLFPAINGDASPLNACAPKARDCEALARQLCAAHWGAYVALLTNSATGLAAFRDPSGQVECLSWTLPQGFRVIASELARVPRALAPHRPALNWDRIALYVAMTPAAWEPLLDGLESLGPGDLRHLSSVRRTSHSVWRPGDFVAPAVSDLTAAKTELVSRVDRCTAALVEPHATLITELSGGLDSSIVAAALGETGFAGRVAQWLNRYGDRAEGDERDFARLVTDRLGVALTTTRKPLTPLDQAGLAETATGLWPAINSVDAGRDVDTVCRLDETGASGIISGDGGDAVFFQMPTPLVWADELRRRGLAALTSPLLADVARRTHLSVWSVIGRAWAEHRGRAPPDMTPSPFVTSEVRDGYAKAAHPWVRDALRQGVPPAKCLQVVALANSQLFLGPSRRTAQADLLFPLLSQPVMEFCLSIAAPDLASGSFDRPFARAAFAGRLPEGVLARRAKGNLTAYFARLVAASADWLAPYLLDGCLCDAGVLDRTAVASALQPDQILWTTEASGLLTVAAVEAWVRHWQGRAPDSAAASRHRLQP